MQTGKGADLGRNKCWANSWIRGSKGLVVCKWNTCLATLLSLSSMLYMCVQSKVRPWDLHAFVCAAGVSSSNVPVQVVSKEAKCACTGIEQGAAAP